MRYIIFIFFIFLSLTSSAQEIMTNPGTRSQGMANSSVALADEQSPVNNQAGLGMLHNFSISAYGGRRFMIAGVNDFGLAAVIPTGIKKNGTFGLGINYFGNTYYNNNKITADYGMQLSDNVSIGVGLDYLEASIQGYGKKNFVAAELGVMAKVNKQVWLAAHVFNPVNFQKKNTVTNMQLPTTFRLGAAYFVSKQVLLNAEVQKDFTNPVIIKAGIEYLINTMLYLRCGYATNPNTVSAGLGLKLKQLKIDFAFSYHTALGISPGIGLCYAPYSNKQATEK